MSIARFFAIGIIFVIAAIAWAVLGASVTSRTGVADASLNHEVSQLWGGVHVQGPPSLLRGQRPRAVTKLTTTPDGTQVEQTVVEEPAGGSRPLNLVSTRVEVDMNAEQRKKGLLWFPTYDVTFDATYEFDAPPVAEDENGWTHLQFRLPSQKAIYDGLSVKVDDEELHLELNEQFARARIKSRSGRRVARIRYKSRGLERWTYELQPNGVGLSKDVEVRIKPAFGGFDYPDGALSPSRVETKNGTTLVWDFDKLISGSNISIALPARLNPGPIVSRITFFAPISLLFFLVVMTVFGLVRGPSLHPMHYLFLSSSFFAFHLLLAYLVDHVNIHVSFVLSSAVSIGLVTSYLRIVAGAKFAVLRAGVSQLLFLVLFSYAFFFEGYAGLIVTIGAIATLFSLMQATAHLNWTDVFSRKKPEHRDGSPYRTRARQAAPS